MRPLAAILAFVVLQLAALAQISPEEHASHHPGQAASPGASPAPSAMPGMGATSGPGAMGKMEGMGNMGASPAPGAKPGGGMMEGMGEMMKEMGMPKAKELYPELMSLPELIPEKRAEVERAAHERMQSGTAMMNESLGALQKATAANDLKAMQESARKLHEGMARYESGVAAHRALAEGKAPRAIALEWFRREMNLPAAELAQHRSAFGGTAFHLSIMAILIAFAAAMIWLYFARMHRATALLRSLTGASQTSAPPPGAITPAASPATEAVAVPSAAPATSSPARKWSGNLRVAGIYQETPTVKTFRLMNPVGGAIPFDYLPGQFVTVTVPLEGKPVKRSYTMASSPTRHDYIEITVKREDNGHVSKFLHDEVKLGDLLAFSGPAGALTFTGRECNCVLLIAGGVGITPMMSVLRYLMDRSWEGDVFLLFSIGRPEDFIFREEIEYLARRHANLRVAVTASKTEGPEWKGPRGRITKELIRQTVPDLATRYVHLCGPVPMMEAMKQLLHELGVPPARIKTEAFGPALGKPEPKTAAPQPTVTTEGARTKRLPTVSFSASNKSAPLPPDKFILDVADEIGVNIDNSCRVGTCGTCRVKLLKGSVTMEVEDGLEPGDKEKNIILACQAKSTGDVEVDA